MSGVADILTLAAAHNTQLRPVEGATVPPTFVVDPAQLIPVCEWLHRHPQCYFDMLSCVTGVDNGPEPATMEVIYHLYSIPHNLSLALKVILPRANPVVNSVVGIWKSANWLEREVFDMYGIAFEGHPDLRRILMPADWQGHPLRKDYTEQDTYRDIKVSS